MTNVARSARGSVMTILRLTTQGKTKCCLSGRFERERSGVRKGNSGIFRQGVMCLNRENRRALKKKLRDKGSRTLAADVLESLGNEIDKKIRDGDLVILNVDQIIARKDYPRMQGEYRQFVESSRNKVFVAHPHRERPDGFSALIELEGVETWLFWYGDLIQVENIQTEEGE